MDGGIELLLAIGFEARLKELDLNNSSSSSSASAISAPHRVLLANSEELIKSMKTIINAPAGSISTMRCVDIFPLLTPFTQWDLHLEMHEPDIDALTSTTTTNSTTTDNKSTLGVAKLSWLDWFDALNHCKSSIEHAIKELH